MTEQLSLFDSVLGAYAGGAALNNAQLYTELANAGKVDAERLRQREPVGRSGQRHSLEKRRVRWSQQTLRAMGLLERVPGVRGTWRATAKGREKLTPAQPRVVMLGFNTVLGIAVWGSNKDAAAMLDEEIEAVITSPPYPLRSPRAYGNPTADQYVDFICVCLEPFVEKMARGANIALNISNDIFEVGSPSRSLYQEKLVLALCSRLELHLMDRVVWENRSKPPGPIQWASKKRMQLNTGYEPILVFCNDPLNSLADNRRVLQPHSEKHQRLIDQGGERRTASFCDGAYRLKEGSFGGQTAGTIPKNVLSYGHYCPDGKAAKAKAMEEGLPAHGAPWPLRLARFLVEYLSAPGRLVVDPFAGSFTTCKAAEELGRRWFGIELMLEHVLGARHRFVAQ